MHRQRRQGFAIEIDSADVGANQPDNHVKRCRFARTIGAQ